MALITHWLCVAPGRAFAVKQPLKVLTRLSAGSCPAAGAKSPSLEEDLGDTSEGSTTQCMSYLFVNFFFVNNSFNSAFLSLATEGILTDIIRKHFLKFRTVCIRKGLPWEVMSSLSPAVVRQSLADDFEREASCTGR